MTNQSKSIQSAKDEVAQREKYRGTDKSVFKNWNEFQEYCAKEGMLATLSEATNEAVFLYHASALEKAAEGLPTMEDVTRKVMVIIKNYYEDNKQTFGERCAEWMKKEATILLAKKDLTIEKYLKEFDVKNGTIKALETLVELLKSELAKKDAEMDGLKEKNLKQLGIIGRQQSELTARQSPFSPTEKETLSTGYSLEDIRKAFQAGQTYASAYSDEGQFRGEEAPGEDEFIQSLFLGKTQKETDAVEQINCPWCDGKGWEDELNGADELIQTPCMICDISGRVSTESLKTYWAEREKERMAEDKDDDQLPF